MKDDDPRACRTFLLLLVPFVGLFFDLGVSPHHTPPYIADQKTALFSGVYRLELMKITTTCKTLIADLTSPVAVYLRLRDRFGRALLLEGSDYRGADDCRSFICCEPLAELVVSQGEATVTVLGERQAARTVAPVTGFTDEVKAFLASFSVDSGTLPKGVVNGAFGYASWEAVPYMERISLTKPRDEQVAIPEVRFAVYRYVLAFNHFRNEVHILENSLDGASSGASREEFVRAAFDGQVQTFPFVASGPELPGVTDEEFLDLVRACKRHIARGDVFQIVPSRRYSQCFEGDDFQVYRALRSINPSPYLFYGDFGGYRLFGSSPEAQIVVRGRTAGIYPIAGTTKRTGDDSHDRERVEQLLEDPKENAEHCMLVDLARNDLSRHCRGVSVTKFREVHYFSHVIHLVSEVEGTLPRDGMAPQVMSDTFPAGTLSGAPKHRAMQLLDELEPIRRGHYGGCIGFFGFNGDAVFGIMIRSFLSIAGKLVYQAGMGVVSDSSPEKELNEAHDKLGALRAAIKRAQEM